MHRNVENTILFVIISQVEYKTSYNMIRATNIHALKLFVISQTKARIKMATYVYGDHGYENYK